MFVAYKTRDLAKVDLLATNGTFECPFGSDHAANAILADDVAREVVGWCTYSDGEYSVQIIEIAQAYTTLVTFKLRFTWHLE